MTKVAKYEPIKETVGRSLRSDKQKAVEQIHSQCRFLAKLLAIDITDTELELIAVLIVKYYKDLRFNEIHEAFEMCATRSLNLDQHSYNHYGRLTVQYISLMLNAYRKIKVQRNLRKKPETTEALKELPYSEEARQENLGRLTENAYQRYLNNDTFLLLNPDSVFDFLSAKGLTKSYEGQKDEYRERAKKSIQINKKSKRKGLSQIGSVMEKMTPSDNQIELEAKRLYIRDKFSFWKKRNKKAIILDNDS